MISRAQNSKFTLVVTIVVVLLAVLAWFGLQALDGASFSSGVGSSVSRDEGSAVTSVSAAARTAADEDVETATAEQLDNADPQSFEEAIVERVVDGDTIIVRVDGQRERVRLVGINAPESVHEDESKNTPEGHEASDHLKSLLHEGDTVYLQQDTSYTDQYDRRLAYVWDALPTDAQDALNPETILVHMINAWQVADGYAQARTYKPDTLHDELFKTWGEEATQQGAGVAYSW